MNNQILQSIKSAATSAGDHSKLMLIEQLEQAYSASESAHAAYNAMLSASNGAIEELRKKNDIIEKLRSANANLELSIDQMVIGWRRLFELGVYSSNMFNCYDLLELWKNVERFLGSKNQDELQLNSLELMSSISKINSDPILTVMRDRMVSYKEYYSSLQSNSEATQPPEECHDTENNGDDTEDDIAEHHDTSFAIDNTDAEIPVKLTPKQLIESVFLHPAGQCDSRVSGADTDKDKSDE